MDGDRIPDPDGVDHVHDRIPHSVAWWHRGERDHHWHANRPAGHTHRGLGPAYGRAYGIEHAAPAPDARRGGDGPRPGGGGERGG